MKDGPTCAKIEREPQVVVQREKLNHELNVLEGLIGTLHGRLASVLRSSEPPIPSEACVEDEIVSFAHDIRVQRRRIVNSNELLQDILNRIEL